VLAASNREEAERAGRLTPLLSRIGCHLSEYWLPVDPMATPEPPTSPISDNEDSVEIDTGGVELDETDPTQPSKSSTTRSLEFTEIEGSFKRGITSALQKRQLFYPSQQLLPSPMCGSR
jgi:hypothetical protein